MYRHCMFCSADLGANEVIEASPVGRRLVFDGVRGRAVRRAWRGREAPAVRGSAEKGAATYLTSDETATSCLDEVDPTSP